MKHRTPYELLLLLALALGLMLPACWQMMDPAGTSWTLVRFREAPLVSGTTITAEFLPQPGPWMIEGSASCNSYQAIYERDGSEMRIVEILVTEMYCEEPAGIMEQEQSYLETLMDVTHYRIRVDQLEMFDAAGDPVLLYDPL